MGGSRVEGLVGKLQFHFLEMKLGVAGQVVYYDRNANAIVLGVHTTGPEKIREVAEVAWESLPEDIREGLGDSGVVFAVRQI